MAFTKKYKCMNIGNCELANKKEAFEVPEGETAVCPKCGSTMLVEVKKSNTGLIAGIVGGVAAVGLGALFLVPLFSSGEAEETASEPVVAEPVVAEPEDTIGEVQEPFVEPVEEVTEESATTPVTPETAKSAPAPTKFKLAYGTYDGPMEGGKPHGNAGTVTVTSHYVFTQGNADRTQVEANPGDKIYDCQFRNGELRSGELVCANGQRVALRLGVR